MSECVCDSREREVVERERERVRSERRPVVWNLAACGFVVLFLFLSSRVRAVCVRVLSRAFRRPALSLSLSLSLSVCLRPSLCLSVPLCASLSLFLSKSFSVSLSLSLCVCVCECDQVSRAASLRAFSRLGADLPPAFKGSSLLRQRCHLPLGRPSLTLLLIMTMSAVTLSASRLLVVVVVAAAAVAFGGVDAEVFRGTITDSSCRHDVGTFTFAPQTSFSPEPSVDVAVTRAGFCRVYRGFNESTDTRLEIEDFTTDFRISSVVVDADALDACVADLNVYFAIIRSQAYDAEAECAAFTEGLAEQSVDFSLVRACS